MILDARRRIIAPHPIRPSATFPGKVGEGAPFSATRLVKLKWRPISKFGGFISSHRRLVGYSARVFPVSLLFSIGRTGLAWAGSGRSTPTVY